MLSRFGFSDAAAAYLTGTCGMDSLDEIAYLDGIDDIDMTIKGDTNPGGTVTTGEGSSRVTSRNNGIPVSIRSVANLKLCVKHSCFVYIKPALRTRNGRDAYMLLFDHFLGPNNVGNMASESETKFTSTLYNGEKKRFTWETYVRIHTEQHSVLNGLKDYGYAGIDDSSKVRNLLKGIKTSELDVCKAQVMASPSLRDDFAATV
jgi:hypothetical protein